MSMTLAQCGPARRSPWDDPRVSGCFLLVVALHATLLTLPSPVSIQHAKRSAASAVSVRLIDLSASRLVSIEAPAKPLLSKKEPSRTARRPSADTAAPLQVAHSGTDVPAPPAALPLWSQDAYADYRPRSELTVGPSPIQPIQIDHPASEKRGDRFVSQLSLFVDETGVVRRVTVDGPPLPEPMERAAREAFLRGHFRPGELDGQAVRSRIRIEVVFDSRPLSP